MAPSTNAVVVLIVFIGLMTIGNAQVELDDRFLETRGNDMWLVEFYAPWCGHCKKLEPVYKEVYKQLRDSPVRVGKIDATKHSDVAQHFQIRGFPTIKFIKGDQSFTHRGDRSKDAIVEFATRAQGPAVRKLSSVGKFTETKSRHSDGVFFLYIGDEDEHEDLFKKYHSAAESMMVFGYFYQGEKRILEEVKIQREPTILVFKDRGFYEFLPTDGVATNENVKAWMNTERYTAFPEVTGGSINEMADAKKYLVMVVINPEIKDKMEVNNRLKGVAENVALNQRNKYHHEFQFLWMGETETANSITASFLSPPSLIVVKVENQEFFLPPFHTDNVTLRLFTDFLDGVRNGSVPAQGGNGFLQRLKRLGYDIFSTLVGIWQTSRWLFLLMFCIPTAIISIICYSLCCMESGDDSYPLDDSDSECEPPPLYDPGQPRKALPDMPSEGQTEEAEEVSQACEDEGEDVGEVKEEEVKEEEVGDGDGLVEPKGIEEKKND